MLYYRRPGVLVSCIIFEPTDYERESYICMVMPGRYGRKAERYMRIPTWLWLGSQKMRQRHIRDTKMY